MTGAEAAFLGWFTALVHGVLALLFYQWGKIDGELRR